MTDWVQEILQRYGQAVTVLSAEGEQSIKAFLQPVVQRGETDPGMITGIGTMDERLWVYMGQTALSAGDQIAWNEMVFRVRSSRLYSIGETTVYWWAALEPEREAAE